MKRAIVVCTWSGGKELTDVCLAHDWKYPTVVVMNDAKNADQKWVDELQAKYIVIPVFENRYELGAIQAIYDQTDIDEFWLVQHSVEILRPEVFDIGFYNKDKSISYAYNQFENYLGKYTRKTLDKLNLPVAYTKWHALFYESEFHLAYCQAESEDGRILCIDDSFDANNPNNYIEQRSGRFVQIGAYLLKRRSLDPKSYNIPNWWSPAAYESFVDFFSKKEESP